VLINEPFFLSHEVETSLVSAFLEANRQRLQAAVPDGEYRLVNGMPVFAIPILAMVYARDSGGAPEQVTVLFSSQTLTGNLGSGTNPSFIIDHGNNAVLVHAEADMVRDNAVFSGVNDPGWFSASRRIPGSSAAVITRVPADVVFEGINATTRRNIYLTITVLSLSILFIWFFSKTISRPLKELQAAAEQIETGDYKIEIKNTSKDETGVLTKSFLSMSHALENFERFTNHAVVNMARRGKLSLGGTAKNAVVCFSLIRDFNKISENLTAQGLVKFINTYMRRMVPCITKTGGIVDKFLTQGGVVVMALWGTVDSSGTPAQNAQACINSMLLMRAALRKLNKELAGVGRFPLVKMGCGINSGDVVSGQMGSEQRMEFTVIGDAVNLAARIEGPNDLFDTDILITENVYDLIGSRLVTQEMPSLTVKGKEKPLRVFTVLNEVGAKGPQTLAEVRQLWKE
jgi:adenylate cyclase